MLSEISQTRKEKYCMRNSIPFNPETPEMYFLSE
jgi:hypothetical protein